jgi:hypothetical protein
MIYIFDIFSYSSRVFYFFISLPCSVAPALARLRGLGCGTGLALRSLENIGRTHSLNNKK